jgi:cobalt-zinc-cadmium efflux system protein
MPLEPDHDGHDHATGDHAHGFGGGGGGGGARSLAIALALNAAYTVIEVVVGFTSGSLALVADAGHNLSDVLALGLALGAVWLASRPATPNRSFGYKRAQILAALANALLLVVIALLIFAEAARRFSSPPHVPGLPLILVAAVGLLINAIGAALVFRRGGEDLNLRASFLHLAGDALGSLGVIAAGGIILTTHWQYADPAFSLLLGLLVLASAWTVLRDSILVLLEAAPRGIDVAALGEQLAAYPGVVNVHDLHVWTITSGFPALTAHVLVRPGDDCHAIRRDLEEFLHNRFQMDHTTLQVDHADSAELLHIRRTSPQNDSC